MKKDTRSGGLHGRRWDRHYLQQFQPDHQHPENDDAGSNEEDERAKPVEFLENGEAKPIVTLIDFSQMVSTQHPNAKELYERDTACLYKFFTHKLQFQIPESEQAELFLTWDAVQTVLKEQERTIPVDIVGEENDTPKCVSGKQGPVAIGPRTQSERVF